MPLALVGFARAEPAPRLMGQSGYRDGFDGFRFEQPRKSRFAHLRSIARGPDGGALLARATTSHPRAFRSDGCERHAGARSHHAIGSRGRPRNAFGAIDYGDPAVAVALPGASRDSPAP